MDDIRSLLRQLMRRVTMLAGIGKVTAVNDGGSVQKIQYRAPAEVRGDTPRLAEFGFSSGLPAGSDVVMLFPGGDRSNAVIIASGHQSTRYRDLLPGETVIYDQWGHHIRLTETGIEVEASGDNVTVNNARTIEATASESVILNTPLLKTTGDIMDNCNTNSTTMKQLREAYNIHDHDVTGVKSGDDSVVSQPTGEKVK
ncbi:phage baseplate assembly protein [Salmonella enterica]|nr:phage baseplate assembly protein [Salmonella enterica]EEN5590610.1 phage baseplate assembly protein V [Salmonella enterica subsp. enterica serovar Mountpleasant]EIO8738875.1 phage baseplate assembly protein V [Salmonella enterica]